MQGVIAEGLVSQDEFRLRPYRRDVLTRRSDTVVEYVAPASHDGVGTHSGMVRSNLPISGIAVLLPGEDIDLIKLEIRLLPEMSDLSSTIIRMLELDDGRTAWPNCHSFRSSLEQLRHALAPVLPRCCRPPGGSEGCTFL